MYKIRIRISSSYKVPGMQAVGESGVNFLYPMFPWEWLGVDERERVDLVLTCPCSTPP